MPRKKAKIDLVQLAKLAEMYASITDAACILGITRQTLHNRLRDDEEVRKVWTSGRSHTRCAIRSKQIREALRGNTAMLIWLGKNLLSQADKHEQKIEQKTVGEDIPLHELAQKAKAALALIETEEAHGTRSDVQHVGPSGDEETDCPEDHASADCSASRHN